MDHEFEPCERFVQPTNRKKSHSLGQCLPATRPRSIACFSVCFTLSKSIDCPLDTQFLPLNRQFCRCYASIGEDPPYSKMHDCRASDADWSSKESKIAIPRCYRVFVMLTIENSADRTGTPRINESIVSGPVFPSFHYRVRPEFNSRRFVFLSRGLNGPVGRTQISRRILQRGLLLSPSPSSWVLPTLFDRFSPSLSAAVTRIGCISCGRQISR